MATTALRCSTEATGHHCRCHPRPPRAPPPSQRALTQQRRSRTRPPAPEPSVSWRSKAEARAEHPRVDLCRTQRQHCTHTAHGALFLEGGQLGVAPQGLPPADPATLKRRLEKHQHFLSPRAGPGGLDSGQFEDVGLSLADPPAPFACKHMTQIVLGCRVWLRVRGGAWGQDFLQAPGDAAAGGPWTTLISQASGHASSHCTDSRPALSLYLPPHPATGEMPAGSEHTVLWGRAAPAWDKDNSYD